LPERIGYTLALHTVSIVIPAYNEERRLPASLDAILAYLGSRDYTEAEIVVVDDGSQDGTAACVSSYAARFPAVRLVSNPGTRGKGYSVRHGMLEARLGWRLFTDADLSAPIEELDKLFEAVQRSGARIAIGSRGLDRSLVGVHQPAAREYAGRLFNAMMRIVTGLPYADTQCGFKLYHADAAKLVFPRQQIDGFGFDVEDLVIAHSLKIKTIEVPVRWNNVEGTKVSLTQGLNSFLDPMRIRWKQLKGEYQ
jgi:glycosyltransferase involved in cell wall biosynthesis